MSTLITAHRILRNTLQHLVRNPWHALAATATMTLTFFVLGVFVLVLSGSNELIKYLETRPQVTAFFKDEATPAHILQLKDQLEQTGNVANVKYVSKEEALQIYQQQNINEPELLEFVTADILPASLEVSATDLSHLTELSGILSADSLVEEVVFQKDVAQRLQALILKVRQVGTVLVASLLLNSLLTLLVVISGQIASFGKEIEIMKLVGASSWYVRWPFLLDGAIFGMIAGSIATGILFLLLPQIKAWTTGLVPGIDILPVANELVLNIWFGTMAAGVLLGMVGSFLAMWRHLRV